MTHRKYSYPDGFSANPLFMLLPVQSSVSKLESLASSLYARYEKVVATQEEVSDEDSPEAAKRLRAERLMLQLVLDWLAIRPDEGSLVEGEE